MVANKYKKALYSIPVDIVDDLVAYANKTKQKKSHIVAEAISDYMKQKEKKQLAKDAKSLIGMIHADTPDIQEIKAHRYD